MQSHWAHDTPYYRCRFAAEYALANHVEHPLSINLREDAVIGRVDGWLAREFAPHRLRDTIRKPRGGSGSRTCGRLARPRGNRAQDR
jgi:site-specific DNA recombinase